MRTCRSCGSTEAHACPGGYSWVEPDLCSSCAAALAQLAEMADTLVGLEVPILTLTAVHDNLMLALRTRRTPDHRGSWSRRSSRDSRKCSCGRMN